MNVLFAGAEAAPFAKVGGLADVMGSLPKALRKIDIDARVVMPGFGFINHERYNITYLFSFQLPRRVGTTEVHVYHTTHDGVPIYFVQAWPYFGQEATVYTDWEWDVPRYILFNQIIPALALELKQRMGWFPDVYHVNDWHTGLVPFLLAQNRVIDPEIWGHTAAMLTIHNMQYQGPYAGGFLWDAGVPGRDQPDLVYQDLTDNMLAIGLAYSDIVTTVSPRYSVEIQYPYAAFGLESLIRTRTADLYGVLNGIDLDEWDPNTDPTLVSKFNADNFRTMRAPNKRQLQQDAGLPERDNVPVIGVVSRLVWQKGLDIAIPALRYLLAGMDVQFVALGSGDPDIELRLGRLAKDFGWRATAFLSYNAALAQHIYAGCDIFLMPSHFEPCGVGQMIAMRYGALPLVRETGGLADTVQNYDNGPGNWGTGFVFNWENADACLNTMRWAVNTYNNRREAWLRMQERAMRTDFSWDRSAQQYKDLYQNALDKRKVT